MGGGVALFGDWSVWVGVGFELAVLLLVFSEHLKFMNVESRPGLLRRNFFEFSTKI